MANNDQLKKWAKQYGDENVIKYVAKDLDGNMAEFFFFKPKVHPRPYSLYARGITFYTKNEFAQLGTLIINECWLGGDERFKNQEDMLHITAAIEVRNQMDFLSQSSMTTMKALSEDTQP